LCSANSSSMDEHSSSGSSSSSGGGGSSSNSGGVQHLELTRYCPAHVEVDDIMGGHEWATEILETDRILIFSSLSPLASHLHTLTITNWYLGLSGGTILAAALPQLQHLEFRWDRPGFDLGVFTAVQGMQQLRSLRVVMADKDAITTFPSVPEVGGMDCLSDVSCQPLLPATVQPPHELLQGITALAFKVRCLTSEAGLHAIAVCYSLQQEVSNSRNYCCCSLHTF
jgi:hypothetical protein